MSLDFLCEYKIYPATLDDIELTAYETDGDPVVNIFTGPYAKEPLHHGIMVPSTSSSYRAKQQSNEVRNDIIEGLSMPWRIIPDRFHVKIVPPLPQYPAGPYIVIGSRPSYELSLEDALFKGPIVYTARCKFISAHIELSPAVRVFNEQSRQFGYVKPVSVIRNTFESLLYEPVSIDDELRSYAEFKITTDLIYGSKERNIPALHPGKYTIVRHIEDTTSGPLIFNPVVNFREEDLVAVEGLSVITVIQRHKVGAMIYDLPILWSEESINTPGKMFGQGYVQRDPEDYTDFWYKRVLVIDAEDDTGSYVSQARIEHVGKSVLIAQKIT